MYIHIMTVSSWLTFKFGTFDSFLAGLGRNVALPKWLTIQLKPVQQSRQEVLRAYCPNTYTLPLGTNLY